MRLLVAVLICCVVSTAVRADYDSGVLAYESGRYDIALRNLSTTLRHRRFLFTDSFLLLWKWRVG